MTATRMAIIGNQAFAMRNFRGPLIAELTRRGIEVLAFAPDYRDDDRAAIRKLGAVPVDYALERSGMSPIRDVQSLLQLLRLLKSMKPDVVLCFSVKPDIYGTLAAWAAGVPHRYALIEGLGHVFVAAGGLKSRLLRGAVSVLLRLALSRADRTLFLNNDDIDDFVGAGLVVRPRTAIVGAIGVDLGVWTVMPPVLSPLTFLFVGRLLREKGIAEFIKAARAVKRSSPSVRFVVLGSPDSNPSSLSAEQMRQHVLDGTIEWPGHVEVAPWLAKASVFVLPSYREGVPRSTQEAMAMGRPVITTDVPGCRETVIDGENGFLVPPRNAEALRDAMVRFVDDPGLVETMGASSRRLAEERFDVHQANARIIEAMGLAEKSGREQIPR